VIAAVSGYGLTGVAMGLWSLVQLPWRLAHSAALRALDRKQLARELSFSESVRRPPPSLVAVADELHLGDILLGAITLAAMVVGIAFLGLGSQAVMEAHGTFSGAGVTSVWPSR
ncbi:MAG TPA: hypothetical protein VFP36_00965, partial [Usitatibacter sp.]|nr:hypothetical protein [Usitatibacter sp.]